MSEPKLISPMLDNFAMGDPISEHNGVSCCPAMETGSEQKYIVKIISTPASQTQLEALLLSGAYADNDAALQYFQSVTDSIEEEVQVLKKLSQHEGFLPFEKSQAVPMDDGVGFDLYLLSVYRRTLEKQFKRAPMTHLNALNLGLDLCSALAICRRLGYIYVDLKPENIYITEDNEYRIGDIGFLRLDSLKYASLPERYRSSYTAPEITDAYSALNATLDTYALGLILYQVFNDGALPTVAEDDENVQLPPPAYADYEMSEIILKACAINSEDRWQDPIELGQALVSYMQRNGAHDTPIVPQSVQEEAPVEEPVGAYEETEPTSENEEATEESSDTTVVEEEPSDTEEINEEDIFTEDEDGNLTVIADENEDETAPDASDAEDDYNSVSDEVNDILSQADELIAHPAPDPVIPPEPIEVTIPETPEATTDEEASKETEEEATEGSEAETGEKEASQETAENESAKEPAEANEATEESEETKESEQSEESEETENAESADNAEENAAEECINEDSEGSEDEEENKKKPSALIWVRNILLVLLALGVLAVGFLFYKNYYLQPVESIVIDDSEQGVLSVIVNSNIDESLLSVVCLDTYGNPLTAPVENGRAVFTGLASNSAYTVNVVIDGFHRLTGDTSAHFTTPEETNIVQFQAVTGSEDGSVILGFTVEGPDATQWTVRYTAANEDLREESFTGHMITLTGLTIGTEYTFTLIPEDDLYITGTDKIIYTASKIIKAENLAITSCVDGKLTAQWSTPEGVSVDSWTVRCYSDNGYDQTIVVTEASAVFEGVDSAVGYTVDVAANGMSVSERVFAAANSVTVTEFTITDSTTSQLSLAWSSNVEKGWKLQYTVDNSLTQEINCDSTTSAVIGNIVPGASYIFTLQAADGSNVLGGKKTYQAEAAETFSGYGVTADNMEFKMCKTPSHKNWDRYDLKSSDYTTEFSVGKKASFLVRMRHEYNVSSDQIVTLYVIRDAEGSIVSAASKTEKWSSMWHKNYGELDIPALPQTAGKYEVSVYFNGELVKTQAFTMVQ